MAITFLIPVPATDLTYQSWSGVTSYTAAGRIGTVFTHSFLGTTEQSTQALSGGTFEYTYADDFGTTIGRDVAGLNFGSGFVNEDAYLDTFERTYQQITSAATTVGITTGVTATETYNATVYTTQALVSFTDGALTGYPTTNVGFVTITTAQLTRTVVHTGTAERTVLTTTEGEVIDLGGELVSFNAVVIADDDEVLYVWQGALGLVYEGKTAQFSTANRATISAPGATGGLEFAYGVTGADATGGEVDYSVEDFDYSVQPHLEYSESSSRDQKGATFDNGGRFYIGSFETVIDGVTFQRTTRSQTRTHTTTRTISDAPFSSVFTEEGGQTWTALRQVPQTGLTLSPSSADGGGSYALTAVSNAYRLRVRTVARPTTISDYVAGSSVGTAPATSAKLMTVTTTIEELVFVGEVGSYSSSSSTAGGTGTGFFSDSQSAREERAFADFLFQMPQLYNGDEEDAVSLGGSGYDTAGQWPDLVRMIREEPVCIWNVPEGGFVGPHNARSVEPGSSMNPHLPSAVEIGQFGGGLVNDMTSDPQAAEYTPLGTVARRGVPMPREVDAALDDGFDDVFYMGAPRLEDAHPDTFVYPRGDYFSAAGDGTVWASTRETVASSKAAQASRSAPSAHTKFRTHKASNYKTRDVEFMGLNAIFANRPQDLELRVIVEKRYYNRTERSHRVLENFGHVLPEDAFDYIGTA